MTPAAYVAVGAVRVYQWTLRPVIGANCRFFPSCSDYAIDAFRTHGALRGSGLAARRILRCNPWNAGGYDPVPACDCASPSDNAPTHRTTSPSPCGLGGGVRRHDVNPSTHFATVTRAGAAPPPDPLPQGEGEKFDQHCRAEA